MFLDTLCEIGSILRTVFLKKLRIYTREFTLTSYHHVIKAIVITLEKIVASHLTVHYTTLASQRCHTIRVHNRCGKHWRLKEERTID